MSGTSSIQLAATFDATNWRQGRALSPRPASHRALPQIPSWPHGRGHPWQPHAAVDPPTAWPPPGSWFPEQRSESLREQSRLSEQGSELPSQRSGCLGQGSHNLRQWSGNLEQRSRNLKQGSGYPQQRSEDLRPGSGPAKQRSGDSHQGSEPLQQRICQKTAPNHSKPPFLPLLATSPFSAISLLDQNHPPRNL